MDLFIIFVLFGSFIFFVFIGVPISFSIGIASFLTIFAGGSLSTAVIVVAQRMAVGVDNFTLLAIPLFILAGNIMNRGGIAGRLIDMARVLAGCLPGSLAHVNVLANMLFGAISGSAVASAAAVGGAMAPLQKKEGYDPAWSAAVNITSCPSGLLIPPSNTLIIYSLVSGGTSVAALFLAGYIPGILMGLSLMAVAAVIARRRGYPVSPRPDWRTAGIIIFRAIPSLFLLVIIMGGILGGFFTATEASAMAVVYTLFLSVLVYRAIALRDLPQIILESAATSAIVLLLVGTSMAMSWTMANADIPFIISDLFQGISNNPFILLLLINITLLVIGVFMDITPAILIFTPIFLPIAQDMGIDPIHFGIIMTFNLTIGICTPPVGNALFVGCSVGGVSIGQVMKAIWPFYAALFIALMLVTYIPELSLWLPRFFAP